MTHQNTPSAPKRPVYIRLWPFYIIIAGLILAVSQGWHTYLTPQALADRAEWLDQMVAQNFVLVFGTFIGLYIACTVFMIPGSVLTIAGGFLFGLTFGVPATVIGATVGACILFMVAKSSLGSVLRDMMGGFLEKMEKGFKEGYWSYLFTIRLLPIMPFSFANVGPALLGARLRDFALSTFLGIIPATIAYTWLGAAAKGTLLDAASRGEKIDAPALFGSLAANFFPALMALGIVALIPAIFKRFQAARKAA